MSEEAPAEREPASTRRPTASVHVEPEHGLRRAKVDHRQVPPAITYVHGLGRTVRTVERNRSDASGTVAVETFGTDLEYNAPGAVVRMERGALQGVLCQRCRAIAAFGCDTCVDTRARVRRT